MDHNDQWPNGAHRAAPQDDQTQLQNAQQSRTSSLSRQNTFLNGNTSANQQPTAAQNHNIQGGTGPAQPPAAVFVQPLPRGSQPSHHVQGLGASQQPVGTHMTSSVSTTIPTAQAPSLATTSSAPAAAVQGVAAAPSTQNLAASIGQVGLRLGQQQGFGNAGPLGNMLDINLWTRLQYSNADCTLNDTPLAARGPAVQWRPNQRGSYPTTAPNYIPNQQLCTLHNCPQRGLHPQIELHTHHALADQCDDVPYLEDEKLRNAADKHYPKGFKDYTAKRTIQAANRQGQVPITNTPRGDLLLENYDLIMSVPPVRFALARAQIDPPAVLLQYLHRYEAIMPPNMQDDFNHISQTLGRDAFSTLR